MKEKNRIIAMLLAFTILLLLAACGKTASVIQQEAPTASEAEAEPAPEAAETATRRTLRAERPPAACLPERRGFC